MEGCEGALRVVFVVVSVGGLFVIVGVGALGVAVVSVMGVALAVVPLLSFDRFDCIPYCVCTAPFPL